MSDLDDLSEVAVTSQLIAAAEEASREMLAAIEGRSDSLAVQQDCASFRTLALLLGRLAAECRRLEQDRMDAPVDGMRFWVAKPQHEAALERARKAEAEVHRLSQALESSTPETSLVFYDAAGNRVSFDRLMAA